MGANSASSKAPHIPWLHTGNSKGCEWLPLHSNFPRSITSNPVQFRVWGALPHWGCRFGPGVSSCLDPPYWLATAPLRQLGYIGDPEVHLQKKPQGRRCLRVRVSRTVECHLGGVPPPHDKVEPPWSAQGDMSAHPTRKGHGGQRWGPANPSQAGGLLGRRRAGGTGLMASS